MSAKKWVVRLTAQGRAELEATLRSQSVASGEYRRARVLLLSDADHVDGRRPDWQIGEIVGLSEKQIKRIRQQFVEQGLQGSLERKPRSDAGTPKKMDGEVEAKLVSLCCSEPPAGHERWTLSLLVDELCRLKVVASVCRESVRKTLKKTGSSLGKRSGSASRKKTVPASLRTWKKSSMSTSRSTTKRTR